MARLNRQAMTELLREIVGGILEPGALLPKEVDLVERFGLSRGTIRESVRALEERGLVRVIHGVGAVVQPSDSWDVFNEDVIVALVQTDAASTLLAHFVEVREIMEVTAAGMAAQRAEPAALADIKACLDRLFDAAELVERNASFRDKYVECDAALHASILSATGNPVLTRMVRPLSHSLIALMQPFLASDRHASSRDEHARIVEAICERDPERSRQAMRDHLAASVQAARRASGLTG
jgi:DNA-binding FadR family transcriptional regulator